VTDDVRLVTSDLERAPGDPTAIPAVVTALHGLAGGLYGRLATTPGNLALSPYSVAVALGMTRNGAAGATAAEMSQALGIDGSLDLDSFNGGLDALAQAVEGLAGSFARPDDDPAVIALDTANALFGDRATPWRQAFLDTLASSYGAGMHVVDWAHESEAGREAVNAWTSARTHDRIPEILPEGVVDELTRLVLVNALYFKAPWLVEFSEDLTADQPFHRSPGDSVDVPTMVGELRGVSSAQGDGWQAVRLPYYGGTLAMTVVLPDDGRLADVETLVARGDLGDLLAAPAPAEIRLRLPRWTFRSDTPLKDVLSALGMPTAFTDDADFTPMTDDATDLKIGAVLHQTFVAVDEHGTEAAAATAVTMQVVSMPQYTDVVVDRPFLFVIHDVEHLTPLFLGRVADPSAS
jgi:serpin B